tara:strand:- start:544 stop:789 length:246 start_codon:yes stop_codon:yes gene_type:complete
LVEKEDAGADVAAVEDERLEKRERVAGLQVGRHIVEYDHVIFLGVGRLDALDYLREIIVGQLIEHLARVVLLEDVSLNTCA